MTPPKRWPDHAEHARREANELLEQIITLSEGAKRKVGTDPRLVNEMLSEITIAALTASRLLIVAKGKME